jgi:hypothetical protein
LVAVNTVDGSAARRIGEARMVFPADVTCFGRSIGPNLMSRPRHPNSPAEAVTGVYGAGTFTELGLERTHDVSTNDATSAVARITGRAFSVPTDAFMSNKPVPIGICFL